MNTPTPTPTPTEAAAGRDWESRWASAEATIDPAYERTNAALRRWVDGMEQALLAGAASRGVGLTRGAYGMQQALFASTASQRARFTRDANNAGLPAVPAGVPRRELASR